MRTGKRRSEKKDGESTPVKQAIPPQLAAFRQEMLRFAILQLRDEASAEDAVQDAVVAALEGAERFGHRAQLKTWLFAILKHKIVDLIRRRVREPNYRPPEDEIDDSDFDPNADFAPLFDQRDHWHRDTRPANWGDPAQHFENARFWVVFAACMNRLPPGTARVFMMREMLDLNTDEICTELAMTTNHCWVVLHRARMGLRLCLDEKWFAGGRAAK
jgi:RNA polymerase sigma-70 factor, ECF subfamily